MKRSMLICTGIVLVFAGLLLASDIDGTWKGVMQGPMGETELAFTFKAVGDSLTGTVQSPMGAMELVNGKIDGTNFSFDTEFNEFKINHQCTLEGDSVIVKVPGMNGEEMKMILKKAE